MKAIRKILLSGAGLGALLAGAPAVAQQSADAATPLAEPVSAMTQPVSPMSAPDASAQTTGASDAGAAAVGDIVVTAQKRSQRLQEVPITIQALGAAAVEARRIDNIGRLSSVAPSVQISGVSNQKPVLYIRGIGTRSFGPAADQSVGVFLDDFYAGDASALFGGLSDIERIEVLKGPQGTLYGRNTIAGAISVVTKAPSQTPEGHIEASVGNYNLIQVKGSVSGPIAGDTVLGRLSFYSTKRDGYMRNLTTNGPGGLGQDLGGVRGKLLVNLSDRLSATLTADYNRDTSPGQLGKRQGPGTFLKATTLTNPPIDPNPFHSAENLDPTTDGTNYGANLRIKWTGDAFSALSLTQYRHNRFQALAALDASPLNTIQDDGGQTSRNVSQEFRLVSDPNGSASFGGRLDWILGVFYYHSTASATDHFTLGPDSYAAQLSGHTVNDVIYLNVKTESVAAYGEATFHITDRLSLTGGLRYSHDAKDGDESATTDTPGTPIVAANYSVPGLKLRSKSLDPKAVLSWKAAQDVLFYASYSKGYKSGGFQFLASNPIAASQVYGPERVNYYEAGVKSQWFDRRLTLNLAAFQGDYAGLQLTRIVGSTPFTSNAGQVRLRGIEFEGHAVPVAGVSLDANYTYLDNIFTHYNNCASTAVVGCPIFDGTRLPRSPKHQVILGAQYEHKVGDNGQLTLRADWTYRSKSILQEGGFGAALQNSGPVATLNPLFVEPSNTVLDLRATYRLRQWSLSLWASNVTNTAYADSFVAFASSVTPLGQIGNSMVRYYSPPRMYGATLGFNF